VPRIYLDFNAGAPLLPEAAKAMQRALEEPFGNASSVHWAGERSRTALRHARAALAAALGVSSDRVVFTSGATEANASVLHWVETGAPAGAGHEPGTVVTCRTEHASVLAPADRLRRLGWRVIELPVDMNGLLDPARFEAALEHPNVRLASIMWVNNETGVIQPIAELAERARSRCVPFHTDAVQALGKLPLELSALPIDFASFSAHKIGGPAGVGALYVAPQADYTPLISGGGQERGHRAGTENLLGIIGFGAACALLPLRLEQGARLREQTQWLWSGIAQRIPGALRNADPEHQIPGVLNVSFPGLSGEALVEALDLEGIAVSSGSACHAGSTEPSHVLLGMGFSRERSASALRISFGGETQPEELRSLLDVLPAVVGRAREAAA